MSFNFSLIRNKVKKLDEGNDQFTLATDQCGGGQVQAATPIVKKGGSYGDVYAYKWAIDNKGNLLINPLGLPVFSLKQEFLGNY